MNPVVHLRRRTGVRFTLLVTRTAVQTEQFNLVILNAAAQVVLPAGIAAVTLPAPLCIPEMAAIWAETAKITTATPVMYSAVTTCHTRFVTLMLNLVLLLPAVVVL